MGFHQQLDLTLGDLERSIQIFAPEVVFNGSASNCKYISVSVKFILTLLVRNQFKTGAAEHFITIQLISKTKENSLIKNTKSKGESHYIELKIFLYSEQSYLTSRWVGWGHGLMLFMQRQTRLQETLVGVTVLTVFVFWILTCDEAMDEMTIFYGVALSYSFGWNIQHVQVRRECHVP